MYVKTYSVISTELSDNWLWRLALGNGCYGFEIRPQLSRRTLSSCHVRVSCRIGYSFLPLREGGGKAKMLELSDTRSAWWNLENGAVPLPCKCPQRRCHLWIVFIHWHPVVKNLSFNCMLILSSKVFLFFTLDPNTNYSSLLFSSSPTPFLLALLTQALIFCTLTSQMQTHKHVVEHGFGDMW